MKNTPVSCDKPRGLQTENILIILTTKQACFYPKILTVSTILIHIKKIISKCQEKNSPKPKKNIPELFKNKIISLSSKFIIIFLLKIT